MGNSVVHLHSTSKHVTGLLLLKFKTPCFIYVPVQCRKSCTVSSNAQITATNSRVHAYEVLRRLYQVLGDNLSLGFMMAWHSPSRSQVFCGIWSAKGTLYVIFSQRKGRYTLYLFISQMLYFYNERDDIVMIQKTAYFVYTDDHARCFANGRLQ